MLNSLLDIVPKGDGNWYFDNFGEAALYAVIGLVIVFVGICLIIGIIWIIGLIMRKTNNLEFLTKKRTKNVNKDKKQAAVTNSDEIPEEVKVAIIAAIMAYYEEQQQPCEFTVKRIKRI